MYMHGMTAEGLLACIRGISSARRHDIGTDVCAAPLLLPSRVSQTIMRWQRVAWGGKAGPVRSVLVHTKPWQGFPAYHALAARRGVGGHAWVRHH